MLFIIFYFYYFFSLKILGEVALDLKTDGIFVGKRQQQKTITLSHPFFHNSSYLMTILSFEPNQASIYPHSIQRNLQFKKIRNSSLLIESFSFSVPKFVYINTVT